MFHSAFETLIRLDHMAWYYLNVQWHNSLMDYIIPFFRNPWFWSPVYLFLAIFMPLQFGRNGWFWCVAFLLTFALTDQLCASVLKPYFHRFRPCHNPWLSSIVHLVIDCGGEYGFPSNHAANHFALGIFTAVTVSRMVKWIWVVAIVWALLVGYSQVYVGAHFPADVLFGGAIGSTIGLVIGKIFNRYFRLQKSSRLASAALNEGI
jgi:membrane-associated phospholipid phosphatase